MLLEYPISLIWCAACLSYWLPCWEVHSLRGLVKFYELAIWSLDLGHLGFLDLQLIQVYVWCQDHPAWDFWLNESDVFSSFATQLHEQSFALSMPAFLPAFLHLECCLGQCLSWQRSDAKKLLNSFPCLGRRLLWQIGQCCLSFARLHPMISICCYQLNLRKSIIASVLHWSPYGQIKAIELLSVFFLTGSGGIWFSRVPSTPWQATW